MSTLKVGTIQDHASSTTAMTVDSTGRILTPTRPAFRVEKRASNQDSISNGVNTVVTFEHEVFDIGGNFANNKFTAPITGIYNFQSCCRVYPTGASGALFTLAQLGLNKGGSKFTMLTQHAAHANSLGSVEAWLGNLNINGSCILSLTAGEEIEVYAYLVGSGQTFVINADASGHTTWFSGFLVG